MKFNGRISHACKVCGLVYEKKEIAEKCRKWCDKYKSCNLKISKNALNRRENGKKYR
jgi:hypothetical protein